MQPRQRFSERRKRFRRQIAEGPCVRPAPVCDPVYARLAELAGFDCGMLAGSMASLTVLGAPDLVLLTLDELAEQVRRICRASDLSLLVDADHGFGNALNVMRTVQELEAAGASALTIEDTLLPHAFGASGTGMVSLEEGLGKIRAALAARSDPELMILARTSAPRMAGPDEVLARIRAYDQSGADALFVSGVSSRSLLEAIVASTTLPLCLGATGPEVRDADFLRKCGVRLWLHGHQPMMAALRAVQDSMIGLAGPGARPAGDAETAANLLGKVVRDGYFDDCVQNFLTPDGAARANTSRH